MASSDRVRWWEPYRYTVRATLVELGPTGIFRARFWVRSAMIAALVVVPMVVWIVMMYPGAMIPWRHLGGGLVVMPLMLAVYVFAVALMPRRVEVRRDRVVVSRGASTTKIRCDRIDGVEIGASEMGYATLKVRYRTPRGHSRTMEVAMGSRADVLLLAMLVSQISHGVAS